MNSFEDELDDVTEKMIALAPIAVGRGAEHVRGVAAPLTPVESGHLVGAAGVTVHGGVGDRAIAVGEVYYPGPYARNQHYSLDFQHETGQALYLEQPMLTEAEKVNEIIAGTLEEAFR